MRSVILTVTLLLGAGLLWAAVGADALKGQPQISNRIWVDRVPSSPRDLTLQLVLVDKAKLRGGVISQVSQWRWNAERMRYKTKGSRLTMEFPQDGRKTTFTTRIWSCKGEAPKPFDLCLELKKGGAKLVLYSHAKGGLSQQNLLGFDGGPLVQSGLDSECQDCVESQPGWFTRRAQ